MFLGKKRKSGLDLGIKPDVNQTRNLLIWSQMCYHCTTYLGSRLKCLRILICSHSMSVSSNLF
uniref:Uncharacterized protein n=1 Tax=Arundo donax TaxID=35708 RepID=A0A0A8Y686_ARUDO